jgi:hypothetical protein
VTVEADIAPTKIIRHHENDIGALRKLIGNDACRESQVDEKNG